MKNTKETYAFYQSDEKKPVSWSQSESGLSLAVFKPVIMEGLPNLALRFFDLALEAFLEFPRVRHRTQDPSPHRSMRVGVDAIDRGVLARLTTPPIAIADEKHLLLCEVI